MVSIILHDIDDPGIAPAKVNLTLRVLGRSDDGYHALHSLAVFANPLSDETDPRAFGSPRDHLTFQSDETADAFGLHLKGPESAGLQAEPDNLVLRAAREFAAAFAQCPKGGFTLQKNLPVASGIGGGSSDAAAALRILCDLNSVSIDDPRITAIAEKLGSDVPVCLTPQAQIMEGRGEALSTVKGFPPLWGVLVNPRITVSTADVFRALNAGPVSDQETPPVSENAPLADWIAYCDANPNDLERPALGLCPEIGHVLEALQKTEPLLARMSGSGATCFAIYESQVDALDAAQAVLEHRPDWWVAPALLG